MGAYLVRRLLINVLVFFLITVAIFSLVHKAPGDPIAMHDPARPAQLRQRRVHRAASGTSWAWTSR